MANKLTESEPQASPQFVGGKGGPSEGALDGYVILDAGDALSDAPIIPPERLENARKTADFIVARFRSEGLKVQLIGDRDIALGREFLVELSGRSGYPFVATNLVDATSGSPVFQSTVIVETAGVKLGIVGLLATSAGRTESFEREKLMLAPLVPAASKAVSELKQKGAEVIVALSQLTPADEKLVADAVPEIQLFLGGDLPEMREEPKSVGTALSAVGGQKGKQLALVTLELSDPAGASAPFVDPLQRVAAMRKRDEAKQRIAMYEQTLKEVSAQASQNQASGRVAGAPPIEAYERQLAAAKAELALAEDAIAKAPEGLVKAANTMAVRFIQLGRGVKDDPEVLNLVEEFRKSVPDPTPGGH